MNRDDIIRLAREAGLFHFYDSEGHCDGITDARLITEDEQRDDDRLVEMLAPFAALVATAEREACIDIVAMHGGSVEIEAAIRARGREMNNLRTAAQQALEALWFANTQDWHGNATIWKAISTLQSALEQPEQRCEYIRTSGNTHWCALSGREWQGLTDTEIGMEYVKWDATPGASMANFARAIEAALKEKNK